MAEDQPFARVLAWLLRNEGVTPEAVERAISSACDMQLGELTTLDGDGAPMRRAFVYEQLRLLRARHGA